MHNYFFFGTCISMFFFPFSVLESLARWAVSSFSSSSTSSTPSSSLLVWRRTRPPIGDHRQKEKKNKSCCQPEPTISAIYLTMATVDGKDLPHDPLSHGRQGMSSLFFLLFFFCRTALGIVLFCFCCHYRPVMASWCGASSILFMTPGLRLSSVF